MRTVKHNPAFMDASERAKRFGGRRHDLEELLRIVRENTRRSHNQHVLVMGPRGIGKTTLLLRVADEMRADASLSAAWLPVVAPEETYRAGTVGEFWLEMVFNLSHATGDARHEQVYNTLNLAHDNPGSESDDKRLAAAALGHILDFADARRCRLALFVENLQMLFNEQLSDRDAWALRETLIGERRIMLFASAVSTFGAITYPNAPLYEQFVVHTLKPLDTDGCLDLWQRSSGECAPRRRMRALEILTGGNPRLLVILAEFAANLSLGELVGDLANLIDAHTDHLKATTEALPSLERKIFVSLAEIWEYASAARVASEARVTSSTASAQLARLERRGAVVSRARRRGKEYRVAERLYCFYHLMRRRGGAAARARAAAEFMAAYYDRSALLGLNTTAALRDRAEFLKRLPTELAAFSDAPLSVRRWFEGAAEMPERESDRATQADAKALPEALRADPGNVAARGELGATLVAMGRLSAALEEVRRLADGEGDRHRRVEALIDLAIVTAAAGAVRETHEAIESSSVATHVEPLLVALRRLLGEDVTAPQEIEEVAGDIVEHIEEVRRQRSAPAIGGAPSP